jgi:hypothetical protein
VLLKNPDTIKITITTIITIIIRNLI